MNNIDLLLTASCFKSASSVVRLIKSIHFIEGNCVTVITSPRMEDLSLIRENIDEKNNTYLFLSKIDNIYACRNWGFIWAYMSGIVPKFYCSMDDDIEFTENSKDIIERLDKDDYSVKTFNNSVQNYGGWQGQLLGTCRVVSWMNGDSMFTRYEDNLQYGLPDCLPRHDPLPICSESEYQQRLCALSKRPCVADTEKTFYFHHFRDSQEKIVLRDNRIVQRIQSGIDFFRAKYPGIPISASTDINSVNVHGILLSHIQSYPGQAMKHSLYDGIFTDYSAIYNIIESEYTQVNL